jgi:ParB family transcriptional regulator, chromosome partitioning protein
VSRRGLGRGLSALIPGAAEEGGLIEVPVAAVSPNPRQPREKFEDEGIQSLALSITEVGVLQPIVVRRIEDGYELVAGERRLRAAKLAGLATVPAIVRESDDTESLREALIENIHRENLAPLELAAAFQELLDEGVSQDEVAERLGYSRAHIANTVRLLALPAAVQGLLADGKLSAGHARALLALEDMEAQEALGLRAVAEGLSVRQVEDLARSYTGHPVTRRSRSGAGPRDPKLLQMEELLADALGTRVRIQRSRRKGKIVIDFGSRDDLNRLVTMISGSEA